MGEGIMKATIEKGRMSFEVADFMDNLSDDAKLDFIDTLSCQDAVIDFVMQQVVEGWTERGSHGGICCTAQPAPLSGIDKARRDIAKASSDIAAKQIASLEKALAIVTKERHELADELCNLRHSRESFSM
jgi:hypothetical protein